MEIASIDMLLREVMKKNATDLHLCVGSRPLIRVDSKLEELEDTEKLMPESINDIVEELVDDDQQEILLTKKSIDVSYSKKNLGRFRCNIYYQRGTYAIAIRTLPLSVPKFENLGLPRIIRNMAGIRSGIILITGLAGSGKSTTIASLIDIINKKYRYHIISVEDPLEYLHKHNKSIITQRELGTDCISYTQAVKDALKEDCDVLMIGEIIDKETMDAVFAAAESGKIVLASVNAISIIKTIDKIISYYTTDNRNIVRLKLANFLAGVVSQQLVPKKNSTGYKAVAEVMTVNDKIKKLLRDAKEYQLNNIIESEYELGMVSMDRELAKYVREDIIEQKVAKLRSVNINLLENYLKQQ